ncbi:hypothetical protein [Gracilinema caldarium]|uniref:Uncharacterized protein n=1 Tax=Gracilinema caldarium (strain ATCC 51460 / DSM 7334 / H1) TaxID=744872 RepID=F8F1U2_GRAC1|nr:hypothetical protein [Gracilinema caldarium]AEJ19426.1 hypothetical protein Spica_1280 [Gracilinema caldarium DSM 7334]
MDKIESHPFWGKHSPLAQLSYIPFLLGASSRLSIAIMSSAALSWVYMLSSATILVTNRFIPSIFTSFIHVLICSFWSLVFGLIVYFFSPVLFYEMQFPLIFTAVLYIISGIGNSLEVDTLSNAMKKTVIQTLVVSFIILIFALIRETFGFGALSLPTREGISEILTSEISSDLAIRSIAATSGGLMLLGFIIGFYRIIREMLVTYYSQREKN